MIRACFTNCIRPGPTEKTGMMKLQLMCVTLALPAFDCANKFDSRVGVGYEMKLCSLPATLYMKALVSSSRVRV